METKICIDCNKEKEIKYFATSFGSNDSFKNRCKACYALRYRLQLKYDFLLHFGCICSCCGETDFRLLTLDHIKNDGNVHREQFNEQQILSQARKENYPKDKYQVLCFNCNCGKSSNNGICPHKDVNKDIAWQQLKNRIENVGRKYVKNNPMGLSLGPHYRKEDNIMRRNEQVKLIKGMKLKLNMPQSWEDDLISKL